MIQGSASEFPRYRPVGEGGLLVEFGETIDEAIHARVLMLDRALEADSVEGVIESVPAYASLLIVFDPLITDHDTVRNAVELRAAREFAKDMERSIREVRVCYDPEFSPDLPRVAEMANLSVEQVIAAHLAGDYSVFMYGFAPGYAYLAGVPEAIQLPRKEAAIRDVPAGSVLIAGPQCLVTTLMMPTGWWIIGRSATRILDVRAQDRPFLFDVGDGVRFRRVTRAEFERAPS